MVHLLAGKPGEVLVSTKVIRVLFSLSRIRVESERLVVHAVEPDAGAALHDEIVGNNLVGDALRRPNIAGETAIHPDGSSRTSCAWSYHPPHF